MTVTTLTPTLIGNVYIDKKLQKADATFQLVKNDKSSIGSVWSDNPISLTQDEKSTIKNLPQVLDFLNGNMKSPSDMAGISPGKIAVPILHTLDTKFRAAVTRYKDLLAFAESDDLKIIDRFTGKKLRSFSGLKGLGFKWLKTFGGKVYSITKAAREWSVHRKAFMVTVGAFEKVRLEEIKTIISNSITPILANIAKKPEEDEALLLQLNQLTAVFLALFPDTKDAEVQKGKDLLAKVTPAMLGKIALKS